MLGLNWMCFDSKRPLGRLLGDRASFLLILKRFGVPIWDHFGSFGGPFCLLGGLEPENGGLWGEAAAESVFLVIWGQILGCLGPEKHGFRERGVAISHFSQDLIF